MKYLKSNSYNEKGILNWVEILIRHIDLRGKGVHGVNHAHVT